MTAPKLTPWFPPEVKPVWPGVYQVKGDRLEWFRRWDGHNWYCGDSSVKQAAATWHSVFYGARAPWRGVSRRA